jgi:hypothetical protein
MYFNEFLCNRSLIIIIIVIIVIIIVIVIIIAIVMIIIIIIIMCQEFGAHLIYGIKFRPLPVKVET